MTHTPLLQVDDLTVSFGDGTPVVRNVSFTVNRGETVALVGESGSGKSVTALSIPRLLPERATRNTSGSIRLDGEELTAAPKAVLEGIRGARIGIVFQEPMTSLNPLHTVDKQIGEALRLHRAVSPHATRARTLQLLEQVGISNPTQRLDSYPHQLSGGQRQRVMIAMALANEPDLLIADEPTTALDVTTQAQILELLAELQSRLGMAMLLITHDLRIVRKLASRVYVMQAGRIVEAGSVRNVFAHPTQPYTRALIEAKPRGRAVEAPRDAPIVVATRELGVRYPIRRGLLRRTRGHRIAVEGLTLRVREGHTLGVVGESGSGKTTLGLALLRLESSVGSIQFTGREIQGLRSRALRPLRREMQIVFQDPFASLSPRMSVAEIIEEGLRAHNLGATDAERQDLVVQALQEVGMGPESRNRYPHEFSGGQRQRIAIARAVVLKPRFVVLDEPTSAVDRPVQAQIIELLRDLQRRYRLAYLFISHDLEVIRALSDEVIVMRNGRVLEHGPAQQIFANARHPYTRALLAAALHLETRNIEGTGAPTSP